MADLAKVVHPDQRGLLRRVSVCPAPDDVTGNASYDLGYTSGQLTQIDKTIGGITYRKTITYTAGGLVDTISAWVEQ